MTITDDKGAVCQTVPTLKASLNITKSARSMVNSICTLLMKMRSGFVRHLES